MRQEGESRKLISTSRVEEPDFFTKPPDIRELAALLNRCEAELRLRTGTKDGHQAEALLTKPHDPSNMHVFSDAMRAVVEKAALFARDPALPILICGETGTGKEVVAQYIAWLHGPEKPFIAVNCSALPEQLIEAELFGYEKGAFTGASAAGYKGVFERAGDGTVFLDEIGTMDMHLQSKLLRVLEQKSFMRVGGSVVHALSSRILAATNANLENAVAGGHFRRDLLYVVDTCFMS
ncbi:sigma-54 factor interaction domain-containing protein [Desulfovibrio desulfuricans]|uniref:sigma-54 factor interaction domain-containing protein n=2 Tax=Desulfovibrio desulfuricans TaxID=876 RepID=UPI0023AEC534|nr:sigma-54 factor interaction domain-containing protein [Desulfovibrio desulfuricans]MDE8729985.1 sigma-54 factor interaction domain-containing protein [Desulfovibrio desulfuricans]